METCQNIASTMPSRFSGVIEASRYWVALMSPFVQFIEMATASANCMNLPSRDDFWRRSGYTERLGGELADSLQTPPFSAPVSEDIQTYYAMYSAWMMKWQSALRELRLNPGHESEGDKVRHQKLQLLAEVAQLFLQYLVATDEWAFDKLEDQFRAIVAHTKALLRKPLPFVAVKEEYQVSIEVGFLPGLYMVCRLCRNPEIRRNAIALCPKTHGFNDWDVPLVTKIATWLMEMEGEGNLDIENCRTPQRVRVRVTKIFVNPVEKSAYLLYTKQVKNDPEEMTIGEATIDW
ncbi:hypothetical protein N7454_003011 [Penicillium verhagenii]|nr:hypothetical protein N7454_003011 [Penicillium verhagenii]